MYWDYLASIGALIWLTILLLPWRPWDTREVLDSTSSPRDADLSDITVLIPARNEANVIGATLASLKAQGRGLAIVVVDARSTDGTIDVAQASGTENLRIVCGESLPEHWSGKLWALEQGFRYVNTPLTLLLDADIQLGPGIVGVLRRKLKENSLHLISLMAHMHMACFWERLLMPPSSTSLRCFILFIYPIPISPASPQLPAVAFC